MNLCIYAIYKPKIGIENCRFSIESVAGDISLEAYTAPIAKCDAKSCSMNQILHAVKGAIKRAIKTVGRAEAQSVIPTFEVEESITENPARFPAGHHAERHSDGPNISNILADPSTADLTTRLHCFTRAHQEGSISLMMRWATKHVQLWLFSPQCHPSAVTLCNIRGKYEMLPV